MAADLSEGAACAPNMSPGARAVRVRAAGGAAVVALLALVVTSALGLPWWARLLSVLVPALVSAPAYFEARSNVCILRAAQGTFEHDDRSRTPMESSVLPAIRKVASSVVVKGVATAVTGSVAAVLLSLLVRP